MTPIELELHIKLQAFYKKRMVAINDYDRAYCMGEHSIGFTVDCDYLCPDNLQKYCSDRLVIPRTIDTENPERGLLGMIESFDILTTKTENGVRYWYIETTHQSKGNGFLGNTPTEALLKALCAQEEV